MSALCFQHVPFEGPGVFEKALVDAGLHLTCRLVPELGLPSELPDFLLVMGGPMSVNDPDPWIRQEADFIRRCVSADVPYLGVCLGSQFLAKAMAGAVYKGPAPEIGITRLHKTSAAAGDPVFRTAPEPLEVIEWHGEGIEAPPGATVLAKSDLFPVQAFRIRRAYGLLFHAELDTAGVDRLCAHCPEDVARSGLTAEAIQATAATHLPALNRWADAIIRAVITG